MAPRGQADSAPTLRVSRVPASPEARVQLDGARRPCPASLVPEGPWALPWGRQGTPACVETSVDLTLEQQGAYDLVIRGDGEPTPHILLGDVPLPSTEPPGPLDPRLPSCGLPERREPGLPAARGGGCPSSCCGSLQ